MAIVTPIAGTTRDHVRATVSLEGVPVHLIDTAGLRAAGDEIERIGIERTWRAVESAGAALFITESGAAGFAEDREHLARLPAGMPIAHVANKIDLTGEPAGARRVGDENWLGVSATTGAGVDALRKWLLGVAGWKPHGEGIFMARERHLVALRTAGEHLLSAVSAQAFELMAEDLRIAQVSLGRITGEVSPDDLLGEIFSRFCVGK